MSFFNQVFQPTKLRNFTKKIYGFDIETYDNNKKFYCASIYGDDLIKTFFNKRKLIDYFKLPHFKNSYVCATNLGFDFFGTFYNQPEEFDFSILFRGSDLLFADTHSDGKKFHRYNDKSHTTKKVTFIDTLNYAKLSVKNMGKILNIPKLKTPVALGKLPKNQKQKDELVTYNIRDSEISYRFIKFLFNAFYELGATPKKTIASTSMSLYKNKYLMNTYFRHDEETLLEQFKGYYGGRTEAFNRGEIRNMNYYDFNSLYPSVMLNDYPDPNTLRVCHINDTSYIESYDGISHVDLYCPDMQYPLLPLRTETKLLFPIGNFSGWHTHVELRKAMELGYVIKHVHKTFYYKETVKPFYDFVIDQYNKRNEYKKDNNPMEYVIKILMNSLYGKFGEKFINKDKWLPLPETIEELNEYPDFERVGNYIRLPNQTIPPRCHCFPIWAIYTTAYGRLKLYDILKRSNAVYCDTDSIITTKEYHDRTELGELKREFRIKYGVIVKPKFYGFVDDKNEEHVKIKGLGKRLNYDEFLKFIQNPKLTYMKFMKFKESVRRGFLPNEIQDMTKEYGLEDNKRYWDKTFSFRELQSSIPHDMDKPILTVKGLS